MRNITPIILPSCCNTDNNTITASQYDLNAVIQAFDERAEQNHSQSSTQNSTQEQWSITHAAMDSLLSSSDEKALGGSLAMAYAVNGVLDPFAVSTLSTLQDEPFGTSKQSFR